MSNKPHDQFFKSTFSHPQIAAGYIRQFVNQAVVQKLDLSQLKRAKTSYITPKLEEYFSDMVYTCPYQGKPITISLLFEHKAQPVRYPHVQLLRYILEAWENNIKRKKPPQVILPLIFYHGKSRWYYKPIKDYFPSVDDALLSFVPQFDYHLLDISKWEDDQILAIKEAFLSNMLLVFKHIWDENFILNQSQQFFVGLEAYFGTEIGENLFQSIVVYLFTKTNFSQEMVTKMVQEMEGYMQGKITNTYERILAQGFEKGIEEGIERGMEAGIEEGIERGANEKTLIATKNMLKKGFDAPAIAEILAVPIDQIIEMVDAIKNTSKN